MSYLFWFILLLVIKNHFTYTSFNVKKPQHYNVTKLSLFYKSVTPSVQVNKQLLNSFTCIFSVYLPW